MLNSALDKGKSEVIERIPLYRGGSIASSLFSAFGHGLRETRLTGMLGYIISETPNDFRDLFRITGQFLEITVEAFHDKKRADIEIETTDGKWIIEAKVDFSDPIIQSEKYKGQYKILITNLHADTSNLNSNINYINWEDLARVISSLRKNRLKLLCDNFIKYLAEYHMIKSKKHLEIYARELNDIETLHLFLDAHIYCCDYVKEGSDLYNTLYFAPHFGINLSTVHTGLVPGISYIARIDEKKIILNWKHFQETCEEVFGKAWLRKHNKWLEAIHKSPKWSWSEKKILFILSKPIHAFSPAIKKDNIQKGKGFLSKSFLSFEELFLAREGKLFNK